MVQAIPKLLSFEAFLDCHPEDGAITAWLVAKVLADADQSHYVRTTLFTQCQTRNRHDGRRPLG